MSRLRWPDSTNSVSEKPGTIQSGGRLVETSAHRRFGWPGWLLPSELQGSCVLAWVID